MTWREGRLESNQIMKKLYLALALSITVMAEGREWTSADGKSRFEAELASYSTETKILVVDKAGIEIKFSADRLSEQDRQWLLENAEEIKILSDERAKKLELRKDSPVIKGLGKSLRRLAGGGIKATALSAEVEYILLYFASST